MSQMSFMDHTKANLDEASLSFEQKLKRDHRVIASVFREHITECEKIIEHYHSYRFDTFSEKIRHTNLLMQKLKEMHELELAKHPALLPDLMHETRMASLAAAKDMLSQCLAPSLKSQSVLRPVI